MAEFDPDAFLGNTSKKTVAPSKGFDPDEFLGKTSTPSKSSSSIFGDKVSTQTLSDLVTGKEPPKTTGPGTFVREAVLSSPGTAAGVSAATAVGTATAPFGPWVAIPSAIVAGGAAGFAANYLEEEGLTALEESSPLAKKYMSMLNVDKATREAGRKEHEYYALGGQLASAAPFVSTKTAATVLSKSLVERGVSGTIQAGVGAGQRAATGEEQDLGKSLLEFGGGALMPGKLTKLGEKTVPSKFKPKEAPITPPPPGATPEQVNAFKAKVKKESEQRTSTSPLVEAAIRNKKTGEIERMGPKHDEQRKAETADTHEQGFVDNRNNFYDREAAVDQAKRAGQLPEDHVLEIPEDGLHSGDLRKAGDERFAITEDQPAGVPKGPVQFKNKTTPTWEELHDHLDGASSVGEAFDRILSTEGLGTKSQRALLTVLNQSEFIRDASLMYNKDYLEYVDANGKTKKDAAGLYENNTHTVQLAKDGDIRVLAHEAMHAGTHRLIQEGKSAAAIKLKELHKLFLEKHNAEYDAALAKFKQENLAPTIGELKQFEKENRKAYGLVNVDEFVAEAFTNDKFKELLSSLKATAPQKGVLSNMWQAFKDAVKEGLGVPENQRTAFDEVIEHGSALVEESKGFKQDSSGKITLVPSKLSQEIHDQLQREGIPVAHTSPYKFGMFDWVKNALSGEGFNVFGAGTYHSQKDSTNRYYVEMAKQKALDKYLESPEGKADKVKLDAIERQVIVAEQRLSDLESQLKNIAQDKELLRDELVGPESGIKDTAKRAIQELEALEKQLGNEYSLAKEDFQNIKFESFFERGQLAEKIKVPTYHSSIKATSDELLDWNSTNQSDIVKKAFKNLGIETDISVSKKEIDKAINSTDWYGNIEEDGFTAISVLGQDYKISFNEATFYPDGTLKIDKYIVEHTGEIVDTLDEAKKMTREAIYNMNSLADISAKHMNMLSEKLVKSNGRIVEVALGNGDYKIFATEYDGVYTGFVRDETAFQRIGKNVEANSLKELQQKLQDVLISPKTGERLYRELSKKFEPTDKATRNLITDVEAEQIGQVKASIALAEQGVVGNVHNAQGGTEKKFRNYVVFDDSKTTQNLVTLASKAEPKDTVTTSLKDELATKTSEPVAKAFEKVDPRSVPNEEEMIKHATDIHERFGEEEAVKFFEDYQKDLKERSIPVPNNKEQLEDAFHKVSTFATKDRSEHTVGYNKTSIGDLGERPSILNPIERSKWDKEAARRLKEMNELREAAFLVRENGGKVSGELGKVLDAIDAENIALVRKIKAMGGDVGEEFVTGQSRIRMFSEKEKPGWKETLEEFFSNKMSFGDKVADQVNSAIERKVYQTDDGRVIEFHRQPKDVTTPKGEIKQGTQIFEWKNKQKRLIGSSDDINFKRGDKFTVNGKELTVVDGKVPEIEKHSTYKYWHDAEASARIANMGLRKMARELELMNNLKQSELFKQIAHGPDQDIKDLPKHYVQPENIGLIPQLDGWKFDPKTAAIINDFAKVWDNTMWMKATNALVKNMMLNPVPHMFNEVMHLWNARGFTGWVDPRQLGTFADTARVAWRDVGNQTQFYRDIMREGGSVLGADPRNNKYFQAIQKEAQKQMFETPEMQRSMTQLAKKLGTSVGDLYNGISNASQKAMWFTRDVMYVQYIREIMTRQEKSTGVKMELKDAIAQAERHMPNYRMPSEVLNSRKIAQVLKNPNIDLFSRYHYGMVKSLVNTIKDVDPRNLKTPEGRAHFREGVDSMLAIGVAMGVMYPLMDKMAEAVFGEGAEQRRAGPFHLLKAGLDVYEGKKDLSALIWPVFTFNPVLLTLGQLGFNKKIFTGKSIYHPDDTFVNKASDVGEYVVKQVPQVSPIMSAVSDEEGGTTKLLARQFDIKAKTEKELAREKRAKELQEKEKKGRDTKREKKTYNP